MNQFADREVALFGIERPEPHYRFVGTIGGENAYECVNLCGAITRDQNTHTAWHEEMGH